MSSFRSWVLFFLVCSSLASPHADAIEARPRVKQAIKRMERAVRGRVRVSLSTATGVATHVATPIGKPIPLTTGQSASLEGLTQAFLSAYGAAFGLERSSQSTIIRTHGPDEVGMHHVRLGQIHEGVPVRGGELTVHLRGSALVSVLGKMVPDLDGVGTVPGLASRDAVRRAEGIAQALGLTDVRLGIPRLEILNLGLLNGARTPSQLAWFVEATGSEFREFLWLDAHSGALLLRLDQSPHALDRFIYEYTGSALPGRLVRREHDPPIGDQDADHAYDYSADAYAYFFREHGRDSFDGAGAQMVVTVHWPVFNAKWIGGQVLVGPLLAMDDVIGHEWTHAVQQYSVELLNGYGLQSGALSEGYADIFGETIDLTNGRGDYGRWWLFDDVFGGGDGVRNMMDPTIKGDPGKMSDTHLTCPRGSFAEGHTTNGIPNHAFALMVDGGSYNGYTISGIGITKAGKIHYRAMTEYLTSISDFPDNYNALRQACADLIGVRGISQADCDEVRKALNAVEMHSPRACPVPFNEPLDAFACRTALMRQGEQVSPFSVDVTDPFGSGVYEAFHPQTMCLAAAIGDAAVRDPATHLESYRLRPASQHRLREHGIRVADAFGEFWVDIAGPGRLLVPTAADVAEVPPPPVFYSHGVDHYTCYTARISSGTPAFPRSVRVRASDPHDSRAYDVRRPTRLCAPASRDGSAVKRPAGYLMCHRVRRARGEPGARRLPAFASNTPSPQRLDLAETKELCLPAARDPVCGDLRANRPGEECDGTDDSACARGCRADCTCAVCGNDLLEPGEECDGADAPRCVGYCGADCICRPHPVTNDRCAQATSIVTFPFTDFTDTREATVSADEPLPSCGYESARGVWYRVTAPGDGTIIADTEESNYLTNAAAYSGSCDSLLEISCSDFQPDFLGSRKARLDFDVEAGTSYYIHVLADLEDDAESVLKLEVKFRDPTGR